MTRLRLTRLLSEKKNSLLRPVFIQLRIYTLRSLNLKTFRRFRSQDTLRSYFALWCRLRVQVSQFKQTAANHLRVVLASKLLALKRGVFACLSADPLGRPSDSLFQDLSLQEELMSPEFGALDERALIREDSPAPSQNSEIPTPPKSPPLERELNLDLSKIIGSGAPCEPALLPRSETMFDFNTQSEGSGAMLSESRLARSCNDGQRSTTPPGKENIYAGYFQVYLAK